MTNAVIFKAILLNLRKTDLRPIFTSLFTLNHTAPIKCINRLIFSLFDEIRH